MIESSVLREAEVGTEIGFRERMGDVARKATIDEGVFLCEGTGILDLVERVWIGSGRRALFEEIS